MGKIGRGYGSEWHLLRYLGYHRTFLQNEIISKTGGDNIQWLDFKFSNKNKPLKRSHELKGVEFLDEQIYARQRRLWKEYWPQRGNAPNWDAVGQLFTKDKREWLLVEAKSHVEELNSYCNAEPRSKKKIADALEQAMKSYKVEDVSVEKWLNGYYQFCNRLTMLHFLEKVCDPPSSTHLLMIYFYGDQKKGWNCPQSYLEWKSELDKMYKEIGLVDQSDLMRKVHTVYLSVNPNVIFSRAL